MDIYRGTSWGTHQTPSTLSGRPATPRLATHQVPGEITLFHPEYSTAIRISSTIQHESITLAAPATGSGGTGFLGATTPSPHSSPMTWPDGDATVTLTRSPLALSGAGSRPGSGSTARRENCGLGEYTYDIPMPRFISATLRCQDVEFRRPRASRRHEPGSLDAQSVRSQHLLPRALSLARTASDPPLLDAAPSVNALRRSKSLPDDGAWVGCYSGYLAGAA